MRILALIYIIALSGCFIESAPDIGELTLTLDRDDSNLIAPDNAWDDHGRFYLAEFGKYIRASLKRPDQDYEQVALSWPQPNNELKEDDEGIVELSLEAAAGIYQLDLISYWVESDSVRSYYAKLNNISLIAGKTTYSEPLMVEHPTGVVEITLMCLSSSYRIGTSAKIELVDARARVVWPEQSVEGEAPNFSSIQFNTFPIARPFYARVSLSSDIEKFYKTVDLVDTIFSLSKAGETKSLILKVSCN